MSSSGRKRSSSKVRDYDRPERQPRGIADDYRTPPSASRSGDIGRQSRGRRRSFSAADDPPRVHSSQSRSRYSEDSRSTSNDSSIYPRSSKSSGGEGGRSSRLQSLGPGSSWVPMPDPLGTDVAGLASLVASRHPTTAPSASPAPRSRFFRGSQDSSSGGTSSGTTESSSSYSSSVRSRRGPPPPSNDDIDIMFGSGSNKSSSSSSRPGPSRPRNIAPSGQHLRPVVNDPAGYPDNPSGYSDQMTGSWSRFKEGTQLDREHDAYKSRQRAGDALVDTYNTRVEALPIRPRSKYATGAEHGSALGSRNYTADEHLELGNLAAQARSSKKKAWEGRVDFTNDHERFLKKKGYVSGIDQVKNYNEEADGMWTNASTWKDKRDLHYEEAERLGVRSSDIPPISSSEDSRGSRREPQYHRERRRERRRGNGE